MTAADIIPMEYDPGARAWDRIEKQPNTASLQDRRAAAIFAASRTAEDSDWLTFARAHRIYESIPRLAALPDIDAAWHDLVEACGAGFGPQMASALDALIEGRAS